MAAIYSRARATISWLGPSSEDSDLALKTLISLREFSAVCDLLLTAAIPSMQAPSAPKNGYGRAHEAAPPTLAFLLPHSPTSRAPASANPASHLYLSVLDQDERRIDCLLNK